MIWNQWKRARAATPAELLASAKALVDAKLPVELDEDAIVWTVPKDNLAELAERMDPDRSELSDDWQEQLDEIEDDAYAIALDVAADPDGGTVFTWEPKAGDNEAAWPIAWLMVRRLAEAIGAEQVTVSAKALLEPLEGAPDALPLPMIVTGEACVLPTGRAFPVAVEDERSVAVVHHALAAHGGWCIAAVPVEPGLGADVLEDLEPVACVARIVRRVQTSASSEVVFLSGAARVELDGVREGAAGALLASGRVVAGEAPDDRARESLLDGADQLLSLTIAQDNMPDDALAVLHEVPLDRLADATTEIFSGLLDADMRTAVLQELDASERALMVIESLGETIEAIHDALDEHDGDLEAARLALLEAAIDAEHEHEHEHEHDEHGDDEA